MRTALVRLRRNLNLYFAGHLSRKKIYLQKKEKISGMAAEKLNSL